MEKIINFLQSYNEILTGAVLILMSLVLITGFQHLKLNKSSINRRNAVFICQILL